MGSTGLAKSCQRDSRWAGKVSIDPDLGSLFQGKGPGYA
jgi:hypothetical protein